MDQEKIYCTHCGKENKPDARFCRECGQPIRHAGAQVAGEAQPAGQPMRSGKQPESQFAGQPMQNGQQPEPQKVGRQGTHMGVIIATVVGVVLVCVLGICALFMTGTITWNLHSQESATMEPAFQHDDAYDGVEDDSEIFDDEDPDDEDTDDTDSQGDDRGKDGDETVTDEHVDDDEQVDEEEGVGDFDSEDPDSIFAQDDGTDGENASADFILPGSFTREITKDDLTGLTPWELHVAYNEICAKHGCKFQNQDLQDYFNSKEWYRKIKKKIISDKFNVGIQSRMSKLEYQNMLTIQTYYNTHDCKSKEVVGEYSK